MAGRGGPQQIPRPADAGPGDSPPWDVLPADWRQGINLRRIRLAFRAASGCGVGRREEPGTGVGVGAAVLVAMFEESGEAELVLTRRSSLLRTHTGEVCLPGGRIERDETAWEAAVREAREEVGLDPVRVEALGVLEPTSTVSSRAGLFPVVGLLPGRPVLSPNPAEVERAFTVRLAELMAPGVYHQERWGSGGSARPVHFFDLLGDTVWGATARVLVDLLGRVAGVPPDLPPS